MKCNYCKTEISGDKNLIYGNDNQAYHTICLDVMRKT